MEGSWFTYSEAAEKLAGDAAGCPAESDSRAIVPQASDVSLVDTIKAHFETLMAELRQLDADNEQLKGELSQRDAQLVTEREAADRVMADWSVLVQRLAIAETQLASEKERAEQATAEFMALAQRLTDIAAENAKAEPAAELAAQQVKPWWRRHFEPGGWCYELVERAKRFRDGSPLDHVDMQIEDVMKMCGGSPEATREHIERMAKLQEERKRLPG
jgi:hypothetical protein